MKYALVISGLLAGLAVAAPKLVVLGYFLLIVPGLILTIAPTVFAYLAATAVIRKLLPIESQTISTLVGFGAALVLGWAVMQPFRFHSIAAYHANELPDVLPDHAIELTGNVRLERPDLRRDPECDYLSLALLDSPLVNSVTTVTAGQGKSSDTLLAAAYTLDSVNANFAAGISPNQPGQIVRKYSPLCRTLRGRKTLLASKAVQANWAIRLSGNERLQEAEPVEEALADWTIQIEHKSNYRIATLSRVTILDSKGTVCFRKSHRTQAVPARIFYFGFNADMSAGTVFGESFHIGRGKLASGQPPLEPEADLLQAVELSIPPHDLDALEAIRELVLQTLDDPAATAARLDLARQYLGLFFFDAKEKDLELIARIISDKRVKDIDKQVENIFSKTKTPVAMRDAFVTRICMTDTSATLRHRLAECLASLPPETFADPTPAYLAIWKSPKIYQESAPLIATLADLTPEQAMPVLNRILENAIELPSWRERRSMIQGVQAALIRLGPQAASATPRIRELFLRRPSPITKNADDADQWRFALARMGVEIEDLPVFPNQSPESVDRNFRQVANKIKRYERKKAAGKEL